MKTRILKTSLVVVLLTLAGASSAQIVINSSGAATPAPDAAAVLMLLGNGNQGLMLPTSNNAAGLPLRNGMVVYDTVLKQIFYCDGATWKAMGGATVSISGNTVTVGASTASLATTGPTQAGQLLFWDGTKWTSTSNTVPLNGNVLAWNGSTWVPTPLAGGGDMAKATYDPTNKVADAFAFANHTGTITSTQIADGAVASIDITNGTVTGGAGGDIAGNTITGTELATNIAISTTASISTIGTGTLSIAGSTTFNGRTYNWPGAVAGAGTVLQNDGSGTLSWVPNGGGMTNPMTTTGDIIFSNPGSTPSRLGGSPGFLKSTGAAAPTWSVVNLASADVAGILTIARGGTGTSTAPTNGQFLIGNAGNYSVASLSGDVSAVSAAGAVTIGTGAITSTKISDGTIADIDVNSGAAIAGTKISPNFGTQNIASTGTLSIAGTTTFNTRTYSWPNAVAGAGTVLQNDGAGALSWGPMTLGGAATGDLTGTYPAPQIAAGVIVDADVNAGAAIAGTKISPSFGSQAITTTGSLNINAPGIISGIGSGITGLNGSNLSTGTVAIARGGTGLGTAPTNGQLLIGNAGNYSLTGLTAGTGISITPGAGTITIANTGSTNLDGLSDAAVTAPAAGHMLVYNNGTSNFENRALSGDISTVSATGSVTIGTGAITSTKLLDGTIADIDVNSGAAIAGTKISPNFGSQAIATTGNLNINAPGIISGIGSGITGLDAGNISAGTLPFARGGTGATTFAANSIPRSNGTILTASGLTDDGTSVISTRPIGLSVPAATTTGVTVNMSGASAFKVGLATSVSGGTGGNDGVTAQATGSAFPTGISGTAVSGTTLGVGVRGMANGGVSNYGVFGDVTGAATLNAGVVGSAAGGTTNWAGLFLGNTAIEGGLGVGATRDFGTTGFVLTSQGAGVPPVWSNVSGGLVLPFSGSQSGATLFSITNTGVGAGGSGVFSTNNALNTGISLSAATNTSSTGSAAQFTSTNVLATGNVVSISGAGISGNMLNISATNLGNTQSALNINHSGTGNAITANKPIQANTLIATGNVNVNGLNYTWPGAHVNGVLTNNGAGTLTWAPAGGFSTNNTVPKGNGTTLVASNIYDNGTVVSIGLPGPAANTHLQLHSAGNTTLRITSSTTGITDLDGLELSVGAGSVGTIWTRDASNLILGAGTNGVVHLTPGGLVGINKSSPGQPLDVSGNVMFSGSLMAGGLPGTAGQVLTSTGPATPPTWNTLITGIAPSNTLIRGNAGGTAQTSSLVTDNGTFIGVSRPAPITGSERFGVTADFGAGQFGGMYMAANVSGKPFYGYALGGSAVAYHYIDAADANKWKLNNSTDWLALTTAGNLGIGTMTPVNRLDVEGGMVIGSTFAGSLPAPANGLGIQGSLGVGTNSPSFDVHINKAVGNATMKIESGNGWAYMYMDKNAAADNSWIGLMTAGADRWVIGNYNSTENFRIIDWQNGGTGNNALYIEKAGINSVGLGTGTPVNRLDVFGSVAIGTGYAGSTAAPVDGLLVDGNVNFGDTSPMGKFNIGGDGGVQGVIVCNRLNTDGIQIRFRRDGTTVGDISSSGGVTSYNAFTGSHYATTQQSIDKGMLVSLTGSNQFMEDNTSSEILYGVQKSHIANDPKVMGSYLALQTPGTHSTSNPHLVMAVGNGDMWVADEGQDLEIGDYLISSAVEGHAMKDIGSFEVAHIVARLAEPVRWSGVTETVNGVKHKRVSVFFESFDRNHKAEKLEKDVMDMKEQMKVITQEIERLKSLVGTEARGN